MVTNSIRAASIPHSHCLIFIQEIEGHETERLFVHNHFLIAMKNEKWKVFAHLIQFAAASLRIGPTLDTKVSKTKTFASHMCARRALVNATRKRIATRKEHTCSNSENAVGILWVGGEWGTSHDQNTKTTTRAEREGTIHRTVYSTIDYNVWLCGNIIFSRYFFRGKPRKTTKVARGRRRRRSRRKKWKRKRLREEMKRSRREWCVSAFGDLNKNINLAQAHRKEKHFRREKYFTKIFGKYESDIFRRYIFTFTLTDLFTVTTWLGL